MGSAVAQAVSCRLLTARSSVRVELIALEKVALGQFFLRVLRFFPTNVIPPMLHIPSDIIWGCTLGPLAAQVRTDIVSPLSNSNHLSFVQ
jgi:hypothetical protein